MTENVKKLNELASADVALAKRLTEAQDKETVIAIAAEAGITLTDADFEAIEAERKHLILAQGSEKLSDAELDAVAGGDKCLCAYGGGGVYRSGDSNQYRDGKSQDLTCGCLGYGQGNYQVNVTGWHGEDVVETGVRCRCVIGGDGDTTVIDGEGWLK